VKIEECKWKLIKTDVPLIPTWHKKRKFLDNNINSYNLEDNKKSKHSSSFQQASEIIHSIQSFFHSFKKTNINNDSLNSSELINLNKKKSISDTDLVIKKDKIDELDTIEKFTNMEKIKIQRSKSIPFNNTNTSQRNSCHYHKHSSLSSSITSSITTMSINHDQVRHYDSESETNDSRVEYSTPKEDETSFSFSSCQSSFSFASAFTNKMAPVVSIYNSEAKGPLPLSPKSISSEKTDMLSVTPHITGLLEDIKEQESISETLSSTPLGHSSIMLKDDLGTGSDIAKEPKFDEIDKDQAIDDEKLKDEEEIGIERDDCKENNSKINCNISLLSKCYNGQSDDRVKSSESSIPKLLNQNQTSPFSSSPSSLSSLDIQTIHPSSPSISHSSLKESMSNSDDKIDCNNKIEDKNEFLEKKNNLSSPKITSLILSSSPSNIIVKSPELFKSGSIENQSCSQALSTKIKKEKSLLFSSSSNDNLKALKNENEKNNINGKETDSSESSINKIKIDNNRVDSEGEVSNNNKNKEEVNSIIINSKEKSPLVINKNLDETSSCNESNEGNRKEEIVKDDLDPKKENLKAFLKRDRKTLKSGSKDSYVNHLYSNIINEDTLIDSENSSLLSNAVNISESELTSIPIANAFTNEIQHSFENKSSNLLMEDLDNAEEEFIQINNDELENEKCDDKIIDNKILREKNEPVITIEDTDLPNDHEKIIYNKSNSNESDNIVNNYNIESTSLENHHMSNNYSLKERIPNEEICNKNELYFSKEITSSIAYNNNEKKDEDNYSYYSNAFSPEISISSVNSDDKYPKGYYDKSQFYRKNKNGKKQGDYEKSIKEYAASLEKEMMDFYLKNVPTEESKTKKLSLLKRIQKIFSERYPTLGIKAHLFGSSVNELGTYNSDVDICLTTRDRIDCELRDMDVIKRILEENGITQVRTTPNAKVPICNFVDPETNLSCDINVNNTIALYNTKMIQTYALIDERVKPLIMTIKYFAKQRMLNDAKTGTLSSYCWVNLVINFLQMRNPPILPCLHAMSKDVPEEERIIIDV